MYGGVLPFRLRILTELVYGDASDNKAVWIAHYNAHNKRVKTMIPEQQLLVMDVSRGDGWSKLCPFLNRRDGACSDVTAEFPRDNTKESRAARMSQRGVTRPNYDAEKGSKYAYVSMLAYPSEADRRDYLMSFLVAAESIRQTGSTHDIVVMVYGSISDEDVELLALESIKVCAP